MKIDNTIGPYDRIDRLNGIIKDQKSRIAELEAEVASLKDMHKAKWIESYSRICSDITEEGEG